MTILDSVIDANHRQLSLDGLLTEIEAEESGRQFTCEVEVACHAALGVSGTYKCGFRGIGTVLLCPKRKRLLGR